MNSVGLSPTSAACRLLFAAGALVVSLGFTDFGSADRPQFQVRLTGLDRQWSPWSERASVSYGALPPEMVRDLVRTAKLTAVPHPGEPPCEKNYRPTAAQSRFVRCRDLTCRFPGCDRPAEVSDIDHTVPYPIGPTHPSNLKLLCRAHHRIAEVYSSHACSGIPSSISGPNRRCRGDRPPTRGLRTPLRR